MYLTTKRCLITRPQLRDRPFLNQLFCNEKTRAFLGGRQSQNAIERRCSKVISQSQCDHGIVRLQEGDRAVGLLSVGPYHDTLSYEVSYEFLPEYWGKGYAYEALQAFLPFSCQALKLPVILAETQHRNTRSKRLLDKIGLQQVDQLKRFGEQQVIYQYRSPV
ncbi:hypothetical protein PsAD2_02493 [Pseudovibrio axinellae]|uniref:N-acetyltransferase domain-containing protein n=1 Tax=Pseudovibrio axinellae TaxID=989403 RepID=A0A165YM59_9HYPH|nr:hypothetical protein PsAD2_02493 [Pseudovibrio axinellae]SEP85481.1 ribosomal-protein-alanine N-acetyltransferase [Pseudovibrio axinellae]